jgi:hypothetical protein
MDLDLVMEQVKTITYVMEMDMDMVIELVMVRVMENVKVTVSVMDNVMVNQIKINITRATVGKPVIQMVAVKESKVFSTFF